MNEKPSPWFKVFALCTALGLGGAYVWKQQQKAAPQIENSVERTLLSGSKSRVIAPTPLPLDQEVAKQPVMLPGSKSYIFDQGVLPVDEKKTNLPATRQKPEVKERLLMSGSKSGILSSPKIDIELPSPEQPVAPRRRTLLPGSKSIDAILKSDDLATPSKTPPAKP